MGFQNVIGWGANIFTAKDDLPLRAVSFYTNDANTYYEIYIYKDVDAGDPTDGIQVVKSVGNLVYPGYHTITLDSPIPLDPDELFSVVIRFENSGYNAPIPEENPIPGYSSKAAAKPGQSFVSADGLDWLDLTELSPNSNVCIKAFA